MDNEKTRVFVFQDEKSSKFWEISQSGVVVTVRYGKSDTTGQSQTKTLGNVALADKHALTLIAGKLAKGYFEHGAVADTSTSLPLASDSAPSKQFKKARASRPMVKKSINPSGNLDASPDDLSALFGKDDSTNRLLAKHPNASSELLEKLSHSSDKATRQAVAANPNTPPETYVRLGQQFPKEFLANPALDLLLLINPALMDEVPEALLVRLLKQVDCPTTMLTWAADHWREKVQLAVAMNSAAPEQALQRLRESRYPAVRQAVEVKPSTTSEQDPEREFVQAVKDRLGSLKPHELLEAWSSGDIGLAQWSALPLTFRLAKAANGGFTSQGVIRGLRHESPIHETFREICFNYLEDSVIQGVASSPDTPIPILEDLTKPTIFMLGDWSRTRQVVAGNPSTPLAILERFSNADSQYLYQERAAVAENPALPESLLELLSKDSNNHVRGVEARKQSTPAYILENLSNDPDAWVRWKLAQNPSTPAHTLAVLSNDVDRDVRIRVAGNPFTPLEVLLLLAEDSDNSIQIAVAENSALPDLIQEQLLNRFAKYSDSGVRWAVAKNSKTTLQLLEVLSNDNDEWVRVAVAANQSTPYHALEALSRDSEFSVRKNVAKNPSTPTSLLEKLGTDSNGDVKIAVVGNPNTPDSLLIKLLSSKAVSVRQALAAQAHRSREVCNTLWKDANGAVRRAVATCEGLEQEALDELVHNSKLEGDLATLFGHPNLSASSVKYIAEKLLNTPATSSAWYQSELVKAKSDIPATAEADNFLSYNGKDPNKAVLAKRPMAALMALCAGPLIETSRLIKVVGSTDWLVRAAVGRNAGTPPNLVKKLSADAHPLVSALARRAQAISIAPPTKPLSTNAQGSTQ